MINPKQLKELVIEPVLKHLDMHSESAVNLLLMVAAHESRLGYYLKQVKGPALGLFQMEPETHADIWTNYLLDRPRLASKVAAHDPNNYSEQQLVFNLAYATAMARIHFWRVPEPLPEADDYKSLAQYAKIYYNTFKGKARAQDYYDAFMELVKPELD